MHNINMSMCRSKDTRKSGVYHVYMVLIIFPFNTVKHRLWELVDNRLNDSVLKSNVFMLYYFIVQNKKKKGNLSQFCI